MPYVGSNGEVRDRRSPWRFSIITDFFQGVYDFFSLFFGAILHPPQLERDNYQGRASRHSSGGSSGGGGRNIRGVKNLQGSARAAAAGG